jgi:hypothetical protein
MRRFVNCHVSGIRRLNAANDFDERALSRPVLAKERVDLSVVKNKRHIPNRSYPRKRLVDVS